MDVSSQTASALQTSPLLAVVGGNETQSAAPGFARFEGDLINEATESNSDERDATFLIFRLQESLFALPAVMVREIHALPELAPLEETSPFIAGVVNVRGMLVPVMDLAARFGHPSPGYGLSDNLVVLRWADSDVALVVNEVLTVTRITSSQIEAPPARAASVPQSSVSPGAAMVAGVAKVGQDIVMLLHPARLLDWNSDSRSLDARSLDGGPDSTPEAFVSANAMASFEPTAEWRPAFGKHWSQAERAVLRARAQRLRPVAQDEEEAESRVPIALIALGGERFGIALDVVREFGFARAISPMPCCPPHILGQVNLRGDIVTLVDIRDALNTPASRPKYLEPSNLGAHNASAHNAGVNGGTVQAAINIPIVVVQHEGAPLGIVIDEVLDVLYLSEDAMMPIAAPGAGKYFAGGALHDGRLLGLLDLARLFVEGQLEVDEVV